MEEIFQQAKFDEKLDDERRIKVFKDVRSRIERYPLKSINTCSRCGSHRLGIANVMDGTFVCEICLAKDELNRRYK